MKKPNIVFIFADQLRASSIGCTGQEQVITPNIDLFARQGTLFTRAISNTPVCTPARATILTGLHTMTHELVYNDIQLRTDVTSIAHVLNDSGYDCGYIGKWHLDCADRGIFISPGPRRQGFDDYWAAYNCNHYYFQGYYYLNDNPEPVWIDGYEPMAQTDLAIDYLRRKSRQDKPFTLFLSWGPPHCPYREVPRKYLDMYPIESIKFRDNVPEHADREVIQGYYAHITGLDDCLGKILSALTENNLDENTIVVFTSDHGDMLFSQDRGWKCKPWSESVSIPLIVRWPGHVPADRTCGELVSLVDLMPTLLSLSESPVPEEVEGNNLKDLFLGNDEASQDSVYINMPLVPDILSFREWRGVVTKTHTYARFRDRPWVFYDDSVDPYQLHNLVDSPEYATEQRFCEELLDEWMERTNDTFPLHDELIKKYYTGYDSCVIYYENKKIAEEIKRRREQRHLCKPE